MLVDAIKEAAAERAGDADSIVVLRADCHHHLQNVWIGALNKRLSQHLNEMLAGTCDFEAIESRYRVSTMFDAILRSIDKEFSLPANYPKGHGDQFKHWLRQNHPGALLVPVERTSGSRQDMMSEGAGAVHWNRKYYVEFLDECLCSHKDNILQENIFIVLSSMEMIALCHVFAITHLCVVIPMRWLAGNSHFLGVVDNWSIRSMMGRAIANSDVHAADSLVKIVFL